MAGDKLGPIEARRCGLCQGNGWVPTSSSTLYPDERICGRCRGEGRVYSQNVLDIDAYIAIRAAPTAATTGDVGEEE